MRLDQYRLDQIKGDPHIRDLKLDALDTDTTCFAIRSYVVARDSRIRIPRIRRAIRPASRRTVTG